MQYGSSAKTSEDASGVPALRMGKIQDGKPSLESLQYFPQDDLEFPEFLLKDGDMLFNRTQTRIVAEAERRLSVVEELEAVVTTNLQRASHLRQAVLQKTFTGKLK